MYGWRARSQNEFVARAIQSEQNPPSNTSTKNRLSIDGESIEDTFANHALLPKQGGQTTACKFDRWLKDWVNEPLPKGYDFLPIPRRRKDTTILYPLQHRAPPIWVENFFAFAPTKLRAPCLCRRSCAGRHVRPFVRYMARLDLHIRNFRLRFVALFGLNLGGQFALQFPQESLCERSCKIYASGRVRAL